MGVIRLLVILMAFAGINAVTAAELRSTPDLGKAEAKCRANETGPALIASVQGLKDRSGLLKLEVYPANDHDFLEDDNKLVAAGKLFRRVEEPVPATGTPRLCVRLPQPGIYAVSILHDRNSNRKFDLSKDGVGFTGNPKLGLSKPKARTVSIAVGAEVRTTEVIMNYRRGLFSLAPLDR